jgi:tetratricopeptide (TPR) repeat protein
MGDLVRLPARRGGSGERHPLGGASRRSDCACSLALAFGASLLRDRGDTEAALEAIDRLTALATEHKLYFWLANGMCNRGSVLLLEGAAEAAIPMLHQGLEVYRGIGVMASYSYYQSTLAAAYLAAGQIDEGLAAVDEGLGLCDTLLACFHRPELLRLRGELLLVRRDEAQAEECGGDRAGRCSAPAERRRARNRDTAGRAGYRMALLCFSKR